MTEIFVGEIVGVRYPDRLSQLKREAAEASQSQEEQGALPTMVVSTSNEYEVEIFPTEVLRGKPKVPTKALIGGCLAVPPELGIEAIFFRTGEGWYMMVKLGAQSGHDYGYDYVKQVRDCIAGKCPVRD